MICHVSCCTKINIKVCISFVIYVHEWKDLLSIFLLIDIIMLVIAFNDYMISLTINLISNLRIAFVELPLLLMSILLIEVRLLFQWGWEILRWNLIIWSILNETASSSRSLSSLLSSSSTSLTKNAWLWSSFCSFLHNINLFLVL